MLFLAGEWVPAFVGYGLAWLVALSGVTGIGWFVLRASSRNRANDDNDNPSSSGQGLLAYVFIVALVAVVFLSALAFIGYPVSSLFHTHTSFGS